jgi:hypothetical protein
MESNFCEKLTAMRFGGGEEGERERRELEMEGTRGRRKKDGRARK